MSIFVNIAAYRDPELPATIRSVINNSTHDLHISIVEQCTRRERFDQSPFVSDRVTISRQWMLPKDARGPVYARKMALQNYAGEDYYLQIDSHTDLIQNWDEKMIAALNLACEIEKSSRVILSAYPAAYKLNGSNRHRIPYHPKYVATPQKVKPKVGRRGELAAGRVDKETDLPELSTTLLAGYIFGPGDFTKVHYDDNIAFWGEEFNLAIRAWMDGWRIYSPPEMYVWHHYQRRGMDMIWNDHPLWNDIYRQSIEYQMKYYASLRGGSLHEDHINTIQEWTEYWKRHT